MKTDELIDLLARGVTPVHPLAAARRLGAAMLLSFPVAFLVLAGVFGIRGDLLHATTLPMFWVKTMLPLALSLAGFWVAQRVARPGVAAGARWAAVVAPFVVLMMLGLTVLAGAPTDQRMAMVLGATWKTCPLMIMMLSIPMFGASLAALHRLAPTQPRLAGAAAGALASGAATAVYALHCVEMAAPFVGVWYVIGMLGPIVAGALLGPRLLRW